MTADGAFDAERIALDARAAAHAPWPVPDRSIVRQGRRTPPVFPLDALGARWAAWLRDAAEGTGAPIDYTAGALLAAGAVLIGSAREVAPWTGWVEPAVIWTGLVGDPSAGKSPGADPVLRALRKIEGDLADGLDDQHREWLAVDAAARFRLEAWEERVEKAARAGDVAPPLPLDAEAPPEPKPPRLIISDATTERLASLSAENPRGLMQWRDELAGWLGNLDRYGGAGGDRGFWIEAYGARPYVVDRVKNGGAALRIDRLAIGVLGAIQPDKLARTLLRDGDDGLAARFLWTWPESVPPRRPTRSADPVLIASAFHRLRALAPGADGAPIALMLDDAAAELFQAWREEHQIAAASAGGMLASALGKAPGQLLRLALVLELLDWSVDPAAPEPYTIRATTVARAAEMLVDYWLPMAARVYGDAALPAAERGAATIARWLLAGERREMINARALRREARLPGLKEAADVKAALGVLVEAAWLRDSERPGGLGRPREDYPVNPLVWGLKP